MTEEQYYTFTRFTITLVKLNIVGLLQQFIMLDKAAKRAGLR